MNLLIILIFYSMLMLSTMVALSSVSWMVIWMMLEINLMSFIPIMMLKMNNKTNFLFKYFIVQTISSSSFLIMITLLWVSSHNITNNLSMINPMFMNSMISISMILKMGLLPFHLWYVEVMMNLSWMNIFLMSSWQKIMPLMIISYFSDTMIIYSTVIVSSLVSSIQGMYQMNLRKIFTFSSINQTSWLTINSQMSMHLMIIYMAMYMIISFNILYMFNVNNFSYIHEIYLMNNYSYMMKFFLFTNILSLAGLPPFLGFMMKLISIKYMIFNKLFLISLILIISSLMTLFFYLRLTYSSMILINSKIKNKLLNINLKMSYKMKFLKLNNMMIILTSINFMAMTILIMLMFN
uniref:NADH-ubiquinone oxidoreductase chain 2 n=1 Tax=Calameuta idolon TaxID=1001283 RepID=A0A0S1RZK3_9HYME|nr:NADH dehydrogenase subunit 2 [Calameuta idolon]ALM04141.1 NADH dehydrogenase subunit 2 [Calameuta idolon]